MTFCTSGINLPPGQNWSNFLNKDLDPVRPCPWARVISKSTKISFLLIVSGKTKVHA